MENKAASLIGLTLVLGTMLISICLLTKQSDGVLLGVGGGTILTIFPLFH